MKVPYTTPTASILELGLLPIEHLINQRKLTFLHHILNLDEKDPVFRVYKEQQEFINELNWSNEITAFRQMYNLNYKDSEIKTFSKVKWRNIVNKSIRNYAYKELTSLAQCKTKTKEITKHLSTESTYVRQSYILKLPTKAARRAFEVRLCKLDIKMNFKSKYKSDLTCKICKEDEETLEHIFQCRECKDKLKLEKDFTYTWVYGNEVEKTDKAVKVIEQILSIRDEHLSKSDWQNDELL